MKPEITTNIKWHLATETLPTENNDSVLVYMLHGYITTVPVYEGHFNCHKEYKSSEFLPGTDVLYWAYIPEKLHTERNEYLKQYRLE